MKTIRKNSKKGQMKKADIFGEFIIRLLAIVMTPFLFVYRLFLKIPTSYSPALGIFRAVTTFAIICWLTKDQGLAFQRSVAGYLSSFMDISLAKLMVSVMEAPIVVSFLMSILIIGGFNWGMQLSPGERAGQMNGAGPYPNIDHAFKDFDKRLGYGTIHGFLSLAKKIVK